MNAAENVQSVAFAHALASALTLVRSHFPAAAGSLMPWRDDPETRKWVESETIDLAFHFPGWSPKLQCRSLLMELRMNERSTDSMPTLIGIIIRGMTFEGERWRLATIGDWQPTGSYLPDPSQKAKLHTICRELFSLFSSVSLPPHTT